MRKAIVLGMLVLGLFGVAGCKKEPEKEVEYVSEDYYQGNTSKYMPESMMMTDKGYYYYSEEYGGLRFFDKTTGLEMYLCNKPECKHDGNAFCVATNDKYTVLDCCLYSNYILAYVIETTDTQQLFKVLSIAPDGSELSEVATVMALERTMQKEPTVGGRFYVHRNRVLLTMWTKGEEKLVDMNRYGTAILNLDTKEVIYLDEEAMAADNPELTDVRGYGEYFYFCKLGGRKGKKIILHRYHLTEGTEEAFSFLTDFTGDYVVADENTIVYLRKDKDVLCIHRCETGENEEKKFVVRRVYNYTEEGMAETERFGTEDVSEEELNRRFENKETYYMMTRPREYRIGNIPVTILADEKYIYVPTPYARNTDDLPFWGQGRGCGWIRVFDRDLNEIAQIDVLSALEAAKQEGLEWRTKYCTVNLRYMGESIYFEMQSADNPTEWYVFRCDREAFLEEEPEFEFVYKMNREQKGQVMN